MPKSSRESICEYLLTTDQGDMSHVIDQVQLYQKNAVSPILIIGETGSGKEFLANALLETYDSKNKQGLRVVDCASMSESLMHSELFGHTKGAFTGATGDRQGLLASSKKTTETDGVLIDEIDKSSRAMQHALLRYLRSGEIRKLGSDSIEPIEEHCRKRIILATSMEKDKLFKPILDKGAALKERRSDPLSGLFEDETDEPIEDETDSTRFSLDFLNRIVGNVVVLPPLRERQYDLGLFASHFLRKSTEQYGANVKYIHGATIRFMYLYPWPLNIPDLEKFIAAGVMRTANKCLTLDNCIQSFYPTIAEQISFEQSIPPWLDRYLGIRWVAPEGWSDDMVPIDQLQMQSRLFKATNLITVMRNALYWKSLSLSPDPSALPLPEPDLKKYFRLRDKCSSAKELYTKMGYKSPKPFNTWRAQHHLDE